MSRHNPNHPRSLPAAVTEQIAELDREIVQLAQHRCELLRTYQKQNPASFPSLREACLQAESNIARQPNGNSPDHGSPQHGLPQHGIAAGDSGFASSIAKYIAGATYAEAIRPIRIAFLGPVQSYSYLAACKVFGPASGMVGVTSIPAVFEEVARDQARYGVVPIENSTDGRIVDTLNMFIRTPVQICGEIPLPIHHNLLARCDRSEIKRVYSKPQALSQCRGWLAEHLPGAQWSEVASTTAAAEIAAREEGAAAVASVEAGIEHGLDIIARSIEDNPNNVTRFVIIGKEQPAPTGNDKTSIMFQVPHKPGALADVMVLFKNNGLNLTWIESFPVPGVANEYFFFVELEGHRDQPNVGNAIEKLRGEAIRLELLGSYPRS